MSDPIYEIYKAREAAEQAAKEDAALEKRESDERERERLLGTVDEEVARAFERLEAINYRDEVILCMFRQVQEESGEVHEAATWAVGNSRSWRWTSEDEARDLFVISSDRRFWRTKDDYLPNHRSRHIPLDLSTLYLDELQSVMQGLERVGMRRSEVKGLR